MKSYTFFLFIFLLLNLQSGFCQNEFSKWYFGSHAGLDFGTSPPTVLTNDSMLTGEGCASIADALGNLLFYTDGSTIYDQTHAIMANGTGLTGHSSTTQSGIIVKQPGNSNIYFVFTLGCCGTGSLCFSTVDMTLAGGNGSVTIKNTPLATGMTEKLASVRHCNGIDIWVMAHDFNSNNFRCYLVNSFGVNLTPIISSYGSVHAGNVNSSLGYLKFSPNGRKMALAVHNPGSFEIYDFDNTTGIVSNSLSITNTLSGAYGCEFSPDGTRLYGTRESFGTGFYQWDLCAGSNSAIIASVYNPTLATQVAALQVAPDGKIYLARQSSTVLAVINNPNVGGAGCNFSLTGQTIAPKQCRFGLPNFISGFKAPPKPFTFSLSCLNVSFFSPITGGTINAGCNIAGYSAIGTQWNFGEPSSGAANSSTLTNPVHTYSSTGTYSVTLILYGNCTNDTLKQIVTVSTPGPSLNVSGNFNICKGDKYTYTATGANSYTWSNNSTLTSIALSPQTTTVYSVSGTLNGCALSKNFTITVDPCTGISALQNSNLFKVYPNPFEEMIVIESQAQANLLVTDINGNLVAESDLDKGHNEVNSSGFVPGIYLLHIKNQENSWRGRLVKTK